MALSHKSVDPEEDCEGLGCHLGHSLSLLDPNPPLVSVLQWRPVCSSLGCEKYVLKMAILCCGATIKTLKCTKIDGTKARVMEREI